MTLIDQLYPWYRASLNYLRSPNHHEFSVILTESNEPVWLLSKLSSSIDGAKSEALAAPFGHADVWIPRDQCTVASNKAPCAESEKLERRYRITIIILKSCIIDFF